jgi:hypothetical protein
VTNRDANGAAVTLSWTRWPEVWLFAALSAADIALTYVLIGYYGHVEGNPIAAYFVEGWSLKGMIWFKLGMITVVLTACHFVLPHRPMAARSIMRLGALTAFAVVAYSIGLMLRSVENQQANSVMRSDSEVRASSTDYCCHGGTGEASVNHLRELGFQQSDEFRDAAFKGSGTVADVAFDSGA